jgi:hypothetical protein
MKNSANTVPPPLSPQHYLRGGICKGGTLHFTDFLFVFIGSRFVHTKPRSRERVKELWATYYSSTTWSRTCDTTAPIATVSPRPLAPMRRPLFYITNLAQRVPFGRAYFPPKSLDQGRVLPRHNQLVLIVFFSSSSCFKLYSLFCNALVQKWVFLLYFTRILIYYILG